MYLEKQLKLRLVGLGLLSLAISHANLATAQEGFEDPLDDSTITYSADYFEEYSPVSVNDMINIIPGVDLNRRGGGNNNRRGLGAGENEVLINGQRMTGKSNSARDQLNRISADQVEYIEIIRGSSEELDVRNSGQVVNVVLSDAQSRRSVNTEINMDRYRDGSIGPGAKASVAGQSGAFNYLVGLEADPRFRKQVRDEVSYDPDYAIQEAVHEEDFREDTEFSVTSAFGYQMENDLLQLNAQYGYRNPPRSVERSITDFSLLQPVTRRETEERDFERYEWEIGGDWEHNFADNSKYRVLFIANDRQGEGYRERFQIDTDGNLDKNLFLYNLGRDRERIVRTSYTFDPAQDHGLELGIEGAQTIRDSDLRLGLAGTGEPSDLVGGLVPVSVSNAGSQVEEIRFETFAVHNWQLSDRVSLESTLLYETSEISQTGDVFIQRDFNFLRPKINYIFNVTPSLQMRASVEKDVSQLSFSDFSANTDNSDEDKNTEQGNPNIVQEKSWVYEVAMEYRLPNNVGVLNSKVFYREIEDVIDRVDVTTDPDTPLSARGNIGDGERWGLELGASSRLGAIGLPNALLTANLNLQDSEVLDPFLGIERRMQNNSRGWANLGFRHDVLTMNMNYGFNFGKPFNGGTGRTTIDIDDIETETREPFLTMFMEKQAFNGTTFRLEAQNSLDSVQCRERIRYLGRTSAGIVEEIEDSCQGEGRTFSLRIRKSF